MKVGTVLLSALHVVRPEVLPDYVFQYRTDNLKGSSRQLSQIFKAYGFID